VGSAGGSAGRRAIFKPVFRSIPFPAALALVAIALAACSDDKPNPNDATPSPGPPVQITAADFSFSPKALAGAVGVPFEVTLKNAGTVQHTFTIDEFLVDVQPNPGVEVTFTVTPSEPGEFNFYCKFHVDRGMIGAINVARD